MIAMGIALMLFVMEGVTLVGNMKAITDVDDNDDEVIMVMIVE